MILLDNHSTHSPSNRVTGTHTSTCCAEKRAPSLTGFLQRLPTFTFIITVKTQSSKPSKTFSLIFDKRKQAQRA